MKKLLIVLPAVLALSLLVPGCSIVDAGPVTTRTFDYVGFDAIEVSSAFQAEIVQSNTWNISITAQENLFDHLNINIIGSTLKINLDGWGSWPWGYHQPKARITMPELYAFKLSGASKGSVSGFKSNHDTNVFVSGASKLDINLEAYDTRIDVSGASRINGRLNAHDMNLKVNGASRAELSGSGNALAIQASGASRADMENFTINDASVDLSGASRVTISPSGKMSVSVSGASSLVYTGNPQLETIDVSGSSTIHKK
jgi:PBP1b-binding outer membrane lipoprotein LpoB